MIASLFPDRFDGRFAGRRAALWLLGLFLALKLVMSVRSVVDPRAVAAGPDAFPLDRYGAEGADAVLMLFALNAYGQLALVLLGALALLRYRAMVPFALLLLILDQAGRRVIVAAHDVERLAGSSGGFYINLALLLLLLIGLVLSIWPSTRGTDPS
jgi:hypothetical protein